MPVSNARGGVGRNIPAELKALPRWVCWVSVPATDGQKPNKKPINPRTGAGASHSNPNDWTTFDEALAALEQGNYAGLMFAMVPEDGFVFVDLDDCRNPTNKGIHKWAELILKELNSYSEISPSEKGVHVFVRAKKPGDRCRHGNVEIYDHARFAAMTGRRLERYPERIESRQAELEAVYRRHVAVSQNPPCHAVPCHAVPIPEDKLASLLLHPTAAAIYRGEQNGQYRSQSEADMALMNIAVGMSFSEGECRTLVETARQNAGAEPKHDGYFQVTFQRARGDVAPVTLAEARATFQRHLHLPDPLIVDVTLAVVASAHLPGDPIWIHLVGAPSTGKTETINAVQDWPTVYALTELTPAGLVSGINSEDGKDHSLLPKLHGKTLAIKDFTPTIDAPKDQRQKLFGRLRDAFDGSQAIHTAVVGTRAHRATFNLIDGVTPAIDKMWRNTSLGERYLLVRHAPADPFASAEKALESATRKTEVRADLRRAACGVLSGIDQDAVPTCDEDRKQTIIRLAVILAKARTFVERDHDHKVEYQPEPEGPSRIAQQLFKLGQGLALISGRAVIDDDDIAILVRVTFDSMPPKRRKVLEKLARDTSATTEELEAALDLCESATQEAMVDLIMLGVCKQEVPRRSPDAAKPSGLAAQIAAVMASKPSYTLSDGFRKLMDGIPARHGTASRICETGGE
jgi:hypothetical protein